MIVELQIDDADVEVIGLVGERIFDVDDIPSSIECILYSWLNGLADVATKRLEEKEESGESGYSGEGGCEADGDGGEEAGAVDDEAVEEIPGDIAG